jgi:hypothetical protein
MGLVGMTRESDDFEQQIHRIHELIEGSGAEVTWNDRIPDPDNPAQPRQIDIAIRRDGALTIVECRLHKERQDVNWIEELIGRKAERYGIVLRDLKDVAPQEVLTWGCTLEMRVYYYQYENLKLVLLFRESDVAGIDYQKLTKELTNYPGRQSMFNASMEQFDIENMTLDERLKRRYEFELSMRLEGFHLSGKPVESVEFSGVAHLHEVEMRLPVALGYGPPREGATDRRTLIQKMPDSDTGFILHGPEHLATIIDVSKLKLPPNAQFRYARTTASQTLNMESLELLGMEGLYATGGPMAVEIVGIKGM